jgi:Predicted transcriptional regulator with C-terminal CBS domains
MQLKEIDKEIYDYDAYLDEQYGVEGSAEREAFRDEARNYMLGVILREERKRQRMTQSQLAEKVGTNKTYISRIEKGLIDPGFNLVSRLLQAMGRRLEIVDAIPVG